jgi:RND family efflux transporter MFP subunit
VLATTAVLAALAAGVVVGTRVDTLRGRSTSPPNGATNPQAGPEPPRPAASGAVYVSPERQQLIGVRTGVVERQRIERTVRTVGVLAYDETRVAQVHTKTSGWIDRVFVDYVGKPVRRGQALFSVYSPDLVTAQADYLIALRASRQLGGFSGDSRSAADALLTAARQRLQRWDVSDAEVAALEKTGTASKTLTLSSPFDGVVLERNALAGQYVTPDMTSFKVADLSTIWVIGQLFEYETSRLQQGQPVDIEFPYGQAPRTLSAHVDFVYPDVDPQTRRVRFRASLSNRELRLKPDTYVTVVVHGDPIDRLMVPQPAVIDTGARKYALLALPNGYFAPRDVEVGPPVGDFYPVISGLKEGDRVVTSAQFLIDSETNLLSAMQNMSMGMPGMNTGSNAAPTAAPPPSGVTTPMPSMSSMAPPAPTEAPKEPRVPPAPSTAPTPAAPSTRPYKPPMPGMEMP